MAGILIVVGASGVGKTAAVQALQRRARPQVQCFEFDSIGVPSAEVIEREFGGGEQWQAHATSEWLLRLTRDRPAPLISVLDAQTRPSFVRAALAKTPGVRARIVLLDCSSDVRAQRLMARGQSELANPRMDSWAAYLRGQADALELPILDTSKRSLDDVTDWLELQVEALANI